MSALRTDYKDDVFSGNRQYRMINNANNTVSFEDVTDYEQVGDVYGAAEINEQNQVINEKGVVVSNTDIPVANRNAGNLYFFYS